jgi:hypothetical protein
LGRRDDEVLVVHFVFRGKHLLEQNPARLLGPHFSHRGALGVPLLHEPRFEVWEQGILALPFLS